MKKYGIPIVIILLTSLAFFAFNSNKEEPPKKGLPPRQTLGIETTNDMINFVATDRQIIFRESDATWGDMAWIESWKYCDACTDTHNGTTVIKPDAVGSGPGRYIKSAFEVPSQTWASITGKPSTFTPTSHTHAYTDITSVPWLTSEVDGSITNELELASQTGQSGKYLTTNGSVTSWATTPSAPGNNNASGYGTGTAYTLTTTSAKVTFGTTSPSITIPAAGTYLIFPNIKLEYVGLTLAVARTAAFKLRRTNNTAADLANATANFNAPAIALAQNGTAGDVDINPIIYTTSNNNDVVEIWGSISGATLTGTMQVGDASIIAIRIY